MAFGQWGPNRARGHMAVLPALAGVVLHLLLPGPLPALTPPPDQARRSWEKRFEELDRNRDGRVSRAEYLEFFRAETGVRRQFFEYEFRLYDRNGDGVLTRAEHLAPVTPEDEFRALDADRDGRLSREEFRLRYRDQDFSRLDRNRDGFLSRAEFLRVARRPR